MTKILLVEDNEINRDMLRRRLERKGYQVIVAVNGAEGVTKTQADRPDLILMDLHLPILDGWEATRQIKANPQTQSIPVIALTADAIVGEREKALAAGCDEYDTKPVDFARLLGKIDRLLPPSATPPSSAVNPLIERRQQMGWTHLRHDLEPPIYRMIGYSDMLLDALSDSQDLALSNDLQKIYVSALQLLRLVQAILNPALLEVQQQDWTIDIFAPALRRELLTPLSTIMGYCELLLEEPPADLLLDIEQIHSSAKDLLSLVNNLDSLMTRPLPSIQTIALPEPLNNPAWRATTLEPDSSLVKNSRILVIGQSSSLVFRQIERQGYQVAIATSEEQVSQCLAAGSYDLILLDMNQPETAGLKVLESLKSQEQWQQIPVLIMAASDQTAYVVQAISLGATDYLTKPFPSALLRVKVAACLAQSQLRKQLIHYEGIVEEFTEQKQIEANLNQQLEALQLELEQVKRSQQVSEIVQTDYFQQLQPNVEQELTTSPQASLPLKVLLVEDNELNRDMLGRRLHRQGYEVVTANDGAEGVAKALSEHPQVILMDISLPVMDGWEATQHLKANPQTCHIPIIALTAHAMTGDREESLASGCDDYDTKPIELPRLLSKIENCLKRSTAKLNS